MKVQYSTQFAKDAMKLPQNIKSVIKNLITDHTNAQTLYEIIDCKHLAGVKNGYRIRRGAYRITLTLIIQEDSVILLRVRREDKFIRN